LKILVTGLGITGKSTFCRLIADLHRHSNEEVIYLDLDLDHDRDKLPATFEYRTTYIIEDVHGPTAQAVLPLQSFNQVYYLQPSWLTHLRFWLSRMWIWFKNGQFAWDADKGEKGQWLGTGRPYDLANLLPIIRDFWSHFKTRKQTIKKDLEVIEASCINYLIIVPKKKWTKIKFYNEDV
jgi:hypothetical protein